MHMEPSTRVQGDDLPRIRCGRVRRSQGIAELRGEDSLATSLVRRLALLACLVVLVATTGTASGALDRTPRTVIENALAKVRPAPDFRAPTAARARVIVTLDGPPLAAAAFARRFAGFGPKRKLNLKSSFSQS